MTVDKKILIVGGDKRQRLLCDMLKEKGYNCCYENSDVSSVTEQLYSSRLIILPVPVSGNSEYVYSDNAEFRLKLKELLGEIRSDQLVLGGGFRRDAVDIFHENQVIFRDMLRFEHFVRYNAYLTAQGAVRLLLESTDRLVTGQKILITGFGRVASALAEAVKGLKADVFIAARSPEQLTEAECLGYRALDIKNAGRLIYLFDYIFNTVPENIFSERDVSHIKDESIYFELASKPYGTDSEFFKTAEKKFVMGNSLPGRYVPYSAAGKICEFIEAML